ncbi:MAG: hypothetical protein RSE46_21520, partial [Janthinobacterium sp.]
LENLILPACGACHAANAAASPDIAPPKSPFLNPVYFFHIKNTKYELQSCNTRNIAPQNRFKKTFCLLNSYILG